MADPVNYELDNGEIARIRLSAEKIALAGTAPAGDPTLNFFVQASGSSRKRTGIRARGAFYRTNIGTTAAPSIKTIFLPQLTRADLDDVPQTVTYKTRTYTLSSTKPEDR